MPRVAEKEKKMVNKVILIGNLGGDPELRYTKSGDPVCSMSVATSYKTKGEDERTEWHKIVVWGKQGETCSEHLSKGRQVYVEGRIQTRKWQDKEGGDRYTTEVVANRVQFLGKRGAGGSQDDGEGAESSGGDDIPF